MADVESKTQECPFCKEEVKAAAVRCKHCLADITAARPDHGGTCPLCQEKIKADAIRCKHCKAALVPGAGVVLARARRPAFIARRRPADRRIGLDVRRPGTRSRDLPVTEPVAADRGGGCPEHIDTRYGPYHLVDEGIGADGWHYCGYEPGYYGIFEDGDLVPYEPTILSR